MSCVAVGCHNSSVKKPAGVTMHNFPKDLNMRQLWVDAVMRKDWSPHPRSFLCTEHFEEGFVDRKISRIYLRPEAVPTIFRIEQKADTVRKPGSSKAKVKVLDEALYQKKLKRLKEEEAERNRCIEMRQVQIRLPNLELAFVAPPEEIREGIGDVYVGSDYVKKYYEMKKGCPVPSKFFRNPVLPYEPPTGEHGYSLPACGDLVKVKMLRLMLTIEDLNRKNHKVRTQLHRTRKALAVYKKKEAESLRKIASKEVPGAKAGPQTPKSLPDEIMALVKANEKKSNKKIKRPQNYSNSIREFVQALYKKSPEAYHYVRFAFENALPERSTLIKWNRLSKVNMVQVENAENVQRNE